MISNQNLKSTNMLNILYILIILTLCILQIINTIKINKFTKNIEETNNLFLEEKNTVLNELQEINNKCESINNSKEIKVTINCNDENFLQTNRWNIALTEKEIDLLAKIVFLEAGNQSSKGQMAVVEVIFNRMIDEYYGGTLEDVLSSPGQFSTWKMRNVAKPTEEVYQSIKEVLNGNSDILPFETLYFARGSNGREIEQKIGDHVFCN